MLSYNKYDKENLVTIIIFTNLKYIVFSSFMFYFELLYIIVINIKGVPSLMRLYYLYG